MKGARAATSSAAMATPRASAPAPMALGGSIPTGTNTFRRTATMGHLAEAMSRFAQPLIDATDGSPEDLQRALSLAQLCRNLAVIPEAQREQSLAAMQPALQMTDEEFQEFKNDVFMPMVRRHQAMFPQMQHREVSDRPGPQTDLRCRPPQQGAPPRSMLAPAAMNAALREREKV